MNEETQVLVAGAGPAGLTTAITLARLGIRTLLVERRTELSPFPRATGISTRTMELIRSWGLEDEVRAGEVAVRAEGWVCETLAGPGGMAVPMGFPSAEQARALSPTAPALVPQDHLEPVLLKHLRGYPNAEVRFGTELSTVDADGDGVTAVLRAGGAQTVVRARYLVGTDGARSTVRTALGIGTQGPGELGDFLTVLFRAPLHEVVGERGYALYMLRSDRIEVMLPAGGGRWFYSRQWYPDTEHYPTERLLDLIRTRAGVPDLPIEVLRTGSFAFAARIADRYRAGRVFLAGDAAHQITPRGATGMNTAIHDGYTLGGKLGWVLRGWADPDLLDSYEDERRPVGVRNTLNSAEANRDPSGAFAADLGGRLAHHWLYRDGRRVSTLDLLGPGLTLLTGPAGGAWRTDLDVPIPIELHRLDRAAAEALGIGPSGAVLVRGDGQPVARWQGVAAADLRGAVDRATYRRPARLLAA